MKPILLIALSLCCRHTGAVNATPVVSLSTVGVGQDSGQYASVGYSGSRLILPRRTTYRGIVTNAQRTVWAVNYHDTSNYDSADIVVVDKGDIYCLPNLLFALSDQLTQAQIIPNLEYDKSHLIVESIGGLSLEVRFYGTSSRRKRSIEAHFFIELRIEQFVLQVSPIKTP